MTGRSSREGCSRARRLVSDRLDGPLSPDDGAFLDLHLVECARCRASEAGLAGLALAASDLAARARGEPVADLTGPVLARLGPDRTRTARWAWFAAPRWALSLQIALAAFLLLTVGLPETVSLPGFPVLDLGTRVSPSTWVEEAGLPRLELPSLPTLFDEAPLVRLGVVSMEVDR